MRAKATLGVVACATLAAVLACSSENTGSAGAAGKSNASGAANGGTSSTNGGRSGAASTSAGATDLVGGANLGGATEAAGGAGESATAGAAGNDSAPQGQAGAAGAGGQADCDGSLLILVDRSASMIEHELTPGLTFWSALQSAFAGVGDALPSPQPWALKLVPDGDDSVSCGPILDEMSVEFGQASSTTVQTQVLASEALGSGTPLPAAYDAALKYLLPLPEQAKSILVITDGMPTCTRAGVPDPSAAQTELVQLTKDAAQAGLRTFVIGFSSDLPAGYPALNALADAGGTARLSNPISPEFYGVANQAELNAALADVAQRVAHCDTAPIIETPGYHALPFTTDFEDGSLDDFRLGGENFLDASGSSASIVTDGANHLLSIDSVANTTLAAAGGHEWTDVVLHAKVRLADDNAEAGLRLRFDPYSRSSVMLNLGVGLFRVRQRSGGSTSDVINPSPKPVILANTWYDIAFSVIGNQVSASLDGALIGSATLSDTTPHGGLALGSVYGGVEYDDVSASAP